MDIETLQNVAQIGSGRYLSGDTAVVELPEILTEIRARRTGQQLIVQPIERYQLFLLAAVLVLAASSLPSIPASLMGKWRWRPAPIGLLLLWGWLSGCRPNTLADWVAQGNNAFAETNYHQALLAYETAVTLNPDTAVAQYNLGNTHYRLHQYPQAATHLQQTPDTVEEAQAVNMLFNRGNTFFQMEDYEQAIAAYQATLRRQPNDRDAKHNLELALQQMGERPSTATGGDNANLKAETGAAGTLPTTPNEPQLDPFPSSKMGHDLLISITEAAEWLPFPINNDLPANDATRQIKDW